MRLLFLSWDGPGTTYHETLFIPILDQTRRQGDEVSLLQFSWGSPQRDQRTARLAEAHGFSYEVRQVPRGRRIPLLPAFLLIETIRLAWRIRRRRYNTLLARSIMPGSIVVAARMLGGRRSAFVYDADGLPADERAEFGGWGTGSVRYRLFRYLDQLAIRRADTVLVRTEQAAQICRERTGAAASKFHVVVNGKDPGTYRPLPAADRTAVRQELGVPDDAPLVVFVGSLGPQYLPDDMLTFAEEAAAVLPDTRFVVLTPKRHHASFQQLVARHHVPHLVTREVPPSTVPRYLAAADLGLALRLPSTSQRAVAPIKVAEYLMCGVPVLYTSGVGDLDAALGDESLGVPVHGGWTDAVNWFEASVLGNRERFRDLARQRAVDHFSLERSGQTYRAAIDGPDWALQGAGSERR